MRHIALTGNIAAGKSTVAALLADWGATVIDADRIVHALQRRGAPVHATIVERFGPGVVAPDGELDRPALRAAVLADPNALASLNAIVHPAVRAERARLLADARERGERVVLDDIPLLFEADDPGAFDGVILVDAPEAVRRARLVRLRGLEPAVADRLLAAQMPASEKRARATWIIENYDDYAALERRTRKVWEAITGD